MTQPEIEPRSPGPLANTLYNIRYWWFFLSQGNWWTKYLVHQKIQKPKPCLQMFASLVTLDGFHLLLSTQLTADLTPEWSGGSKFHPLSHIYAKTPFCCIETVANNTESSTRFWSTVSKLGTHFEHWFLINKSTCKMANTLPSDIFNSSAISCNFNLWSAKMSLWNFLVSFETTAEFGWPERLASFVSVRLRLKSAYHLLTVVSDRRIWITLIKTLLCLNGIFSHQKAMLYQHTKFRFFHYFENLQQ